MKPEISFDNTYAQLPERFYAQLAPTPVAQPKLLKLNRALATALGLDADALDSQLGAEIFAGNQIPEGAETLAQAYAGHQFGNWVPQLGDGRAILLGEVAAPNGCRYDIQLKGAGKTPFSRRGDGRAWLGPVLREYIVSEAMVALGVPTTRALAVATTGEQVLREKALPGAVLTRVASSHIRVGTFQYFAARQDIEALRLLTDYACARHDPEAKDAMGLLKGVITRQAKLVAKWMGVGFIHGVMNTDNVTISGETIDYGPCAFMDVYNPSTVFSSIDQYGRYAYASQPSIAVWNMAQLASSLLPLIDQDEAKAIEMATEAVNDFAPVFEAAWEKVFLAKIGVLESEAKDVSLVQDLLERMAKEKADFTRVFRALSYLPNTKNNDEGVRQEFNDPTAFDSWAEGWRARIAEWPEAKRQAIMQAANPAYIPRNHKVEKAIEASVAGDLSVFERLVEVLAKPYEEQPGAEAYAEAPEPDEVVHATYCGT